MAIFPSLRRLRSRSTLQSTSASASPNPSIPSSPPQPAITSEQTISVPQASVRLRGDACKIGYAALDSQGESDGDRGAGEGDIESAEEKDAVLGDADEGQDTLKPGLVRRITKRWSSPVHGPSLAAIVQPRPELPCSAEPTFPFDAFDAPVCESPEESLPPSPVKQRQLPRRRTSSSSLSSPSSPSLSPCSSFRSPPTSSTSLSSPSSSASSLAIGRTIQTRLGPSGRRVLTSRRRQNSDNSTNADASVSPSRCKRNKGAFGVGDDEDSLWREEEVINGSAWVEKVDAGGEVMLFRTLSQPEPYGIGLGLVQPVHESTSAMSMDGVQFNPVSAPDATACPLPILPRHRPPLAPLQLVPAPIGYDDAPRTPTRRRSSIAEHQPIQPIYPPPPLYPPSPSKSSALSSLTRVYSAYHSSSSSSNSHGDDSPTKRRNSLQPRKTLTKRLSRTNGSGSGVGAGDGPPPSPSARRFSAPLMVPLSSLTRTGSASASASECNTPSSPSFSSACSGPQTPSSHSHSHAYSYAPGDALLPHSATSTSLGHSSASASAHSHTPLLPFTAAASPTSSSATATPNTARRASLVSFDVPESPSLARRRTQTAGGEPVVETSWTRGHRRSASESAAWRAPDGGVAGVGAAGAYGRLRLVVANPDLRPPSPSPALSKVMPAAASPFHPMRTDSPSPLRPVDAIHSPSMIGLAC
ncbi:hypothetical protein JCM10207_002602 [Rhodosporidiobolus poonsookiae]